MATQPKGIKVKLTIADRYNIRALLPNDGNLVEQVQAKSIMGKCDFSSKEIEQFEIEVHPDGAANWNVEKEIDTNIEFTTVEVELLHQGVKVKDGAKQIKPFMVDIALKVKEWAGSPFKE